MANLNAGYYTFEIHYKSPVAVNEHANWDWQTAILQVMWFEDARAVSDGIKCYPTSTATNNYNNWGPINDLQVTLQLPNNRAILSAYQLSAETSSPSYQLISYLRKCLLPVIWLLLSMLMDSFNNLLHVFKDRVLFLPYKVLMLDNTVKEYITLMSSTDLQQHSPLLTANMISYKDNKNLYAMMLPPSCKVVLVNPRTAISIPQSGWTKTDLEYSLVFSKLSHVIIMYQYSGYGPNNNYHLVSRIKINKAVEKHTTFHSGYTKYHGNFGLWQGSLNSGTHTIVIEYRNSEATQNDPRYW